VLQAAESANLGQLRVMQDHVRSRSTQRWLHRCLRQRCLSAFLPAGPWCRESESERRGTCTGRHNRESASMSIHPRVPARLARRRLRSGRRPRSGLRSVAVALSKGERTRRRSSLAPPNGPFHFDRRTPVEQSVVVHCGRPAFVWSVEYAKLLRVTASTERKKILSEQHTQFSRCLWLKCEQHRHPGSVAVLHQHCSGCPLLMISLCVKKKEAARPFDSGATNA
jgi:hypothetical protein